MSIVPCRQCKKCGYYHDFTMTVCNECGESIHNLPIALIEIDDLPSNAFGEIEASTFFVQKCSACGVLNFTTDKNNRVKVCYNCHKTRIASIEPTEYTKPSETETNNEQIIKEEVKPACTPPIRSESTSEPVRVSYDDDDDNNDSPWPGILRDSIGEKIRGSSFEPSKKVDSQPTQPSPQIAVYDNDDGDDDEVPCWSDPLGITPEPQKNAVIQDKPIILSAMRHGNLTFTVEPNGQEYMLGRSANQSEFLSQDVRVSNNHCFLYFSGGSWYVKDNHSSNGTAVNSRDIGLNGECRLSDGDELKLGHHQDSIVFRVTIR